MLPVQPDFAVGRRKIAGDDLDQRRLAGAVVAHQAERLALLQGKVDLVQRVKSRQSASTPSAARESATQVLPTPLAPWSRERCRSFVSSLACHHRTVRTAAQGEGRRKACASLRPCEDHDFILKLRRNEPSWAIDLADLERIFVAAGVDDVSFGSLRVEGGLGRFVRSLVGLDARRPMGQFAGFPNGQSPRH